MSIPPRRGLFDPERKPPSRPGTGAPAGKAKPFTVTELTRQVKTLIEQRFEGVWVEGEISNFKRYGSGHCYFTLKDEKAQLSGVMWRGVAEGLRFTPSDGMKVLGFGRLSVYEPRGQYQWVVERMEPAGIGALAAAFEALKAKLAAEGLFEQARKRPLPLFPRRIALVTSPTGAAIQDMLKVILARWPTLELIIAPVRVQGAGAAEEIVAAIAALNRLNCAEVMIVGRGGGSMEDLWAFNEEIVARAIAASRIPVISAVGHEVDYTIADFVADVRAATPSNAGELVVPEFREILERVRQLERALPSALLGRVALARQRLDSIASSWALRHPEERILQHRQRVDDLQARLLPLAPRLVRIWKERLAGSAGRLEGLSPLKVLERGYSVTTREKDGKVLRSWDGVKDGERIISKLQKGRLISRVERREVDE